MVVVMKSLGALHSTLINLMFTSQMAFVDLLPIHVLVV